MTLSIATWNINSVRLRLPLIRAFLQQRSPDILCLQEIKCLNEQFPQQEFAQWGYPFFAVSGQKGYHGVATLSRYPLSQIEYRKFCLMDDCRHASSVIDLPERKIRIHNLYVPAGGDEPDPIANAKFKHKLAFLDEMKQMKADQGDGIMSLLTGDLNVAPLENDVWSHRQLLNVVSHTPAETTRLMVAAREGNWVDLIRLKYPEPEKIFTWWSYRARDWRQSNRGRRLDHIWSSQELANQLHGIEIFVDARDWLKPSDHVPVIAYFAL